MRNLKKFLALVLAMMMVMGLMVTANASDFKDIDEVNDDYVDAVEVLNALGVVKGKTTTSFAPADNLTRAEFAIFVYRLSTGDVNGKSPELTYFSGKSYDQFTDVRGGSYDYAVKYINYLAYYGVLKGVGGGRFNPAGNVTIPEILTVLVRLCDGKVSGSGWKLQALKQATELGIMDGSVENYNGAATREEMVQLMFNTLFANGTEKTVTTTPATTVYKVVKLSGDYVDAATVWAAQDPQVSAHPALVEAGYATEVEALEAAAKILMLKASGGTQGSVGDYDRGPTYNVDYTVVAEVIPAVTQTVVEGSLGDTVFGLMTTADTTRNDAFGRPTTVYKTKNSSGVETDLTSVVHEADYSYVMSKDTTVGALIAANGLSSAIKGYADSITGGASYALKRGSVVELYVGGSDGKTLTNLIQYYYKLDAITAVNKLDANNAGDATAAENGATCKVALTDNGTKYDTQITGFDADTYVKDARIAVAYKTADDTVVAASGVLAETYVPNTIQGKVTAIDSSSNYIRVDGEQYTVAQSTVYTYPGVSSTAMNYYLDKNDVIIGQSAIPGAATTIDDVFYVAAEYIKIDTDAFGNRTANTYVQAVHVDGTVENDVLINSVAYVSQTPGSTNNSAYDGKLYYISNTNAKGENTLTQWTGNTTYAVGTINGSTPLKKTDPSVAGTDNSFSSILRLESTTNYVVIDGSMSTIETEVITGGVTVTTAKAYPVIATTVSNNKVANVVFVVLSGAEEVTNSEAGKNVLYVPASAPYEETTANNTTAYTLEVYDQTGEKISITTSTDPTSGIMGKFVNYTVTNDVYALTAATAANVAGANYAGQTGTITGTFHDVYGTLLTLNETYMVNIEAKDAVIIDQHNKTTGYPNAIESLDDLTAAYAAGWDNISLEIYASNGAKVIVVKSAAKTPSINVGGVAITNTTGGASITYSDNAKTGGVDSAITSIDLTVSAELLNATGSLTYQWYQSDTAVTTPDGSHTQSSLAGNASNKLTIAKTDITTTATNKELWIYCKVTDGASLVAYSAVYNIFWHGNIAFGTDLDATKAGSSNSSPVSLTVTTATADNGQTVTVKWYKCEGTTVGENDTDLSASGVSYSATADGYYYCVASAKGCADKTSTVCHVTDVD